MLAGVVSPIESSFLPKEAKLPLCFAAFEPVKAHIIWFGCFGSHGTQGETMRCGIVRCNWCWVELGVAHFLQGGADGHSLFAAVEECGKFGFGSGGHDMLDDGC